MQKHLCREKSWILLTFSGFRAAGSNTVFFQASEGVWVNDEGVDLSNVIPWRQDTIVPKPNGGRLKNNLILNCARWTQTDKFERRWFEDFAADRKGVVTCDATR